MEELLKVMIELSVEMSIFDISARLCMMNRSCSCCRMASVFCRVWWLDDGSENLIAVRLGWNSRGLCTHCIMSVLQVGVKKLLWCE